MFGIGRGMVYDGWNRPDDDSTPELSQVEQDEKERREALNEEDDYDDADIVEQENALRDEIEQIQQRRE